MEKFIIISNLIIPIIVFSTVLFGASKGVSIYEVFIEGVKKGIMTVFDIAPTLIALMMSVYILRSSGLLEIIAKAFMPLTEITGFPAELIPLCLMRLVSSSAATGLLTDIFATYGPDSFIGRLASVMMSCTETVFYTLSLYFLHINIRKTRYTLAGALVANFFGIVAAFFITKALF